MEVDEIVAVFEAGNKLMSAVSALGLDCLGQQQAVKRDRHYTGDADTITALRTMAAAESLTMWKCDGAFLAAPSQALKDQLAKAGATPALATITVLEGICVGAARVFFAHASSLVRLERGSVVPIPERWLPGIAQTPSPATTHPNLLHESCNFILWDLDWVLELDYTFRTRLDLVCAVRNPNSDKEIGATGGKKRLAYTLPKIASVHPFGGSGMALPEEMNGRFFGVHPTPSSTTHQQALAALGKARRHAEIAVLPEFCLHSPDGLDKLLDGSDPTLPALVVAGSAHTDKGTRKDRANTSHVFLDQVRIMSVSKYQPFIARVRNTPGLDGDYVEDVAPLDRVLRLAAGTATRLAIAICSDLNSSDFLDAVKAACVNLLLSPSWTPEIGVAEAALATLAGYCQCIGVVANTPGHLMAKTTPFWACSAVPRAGNLVQIHYYSGSPPACGVLDPNLPPSKTGYWTWVP